MSKSTLSVRIPEDKHKYLRFKALHSGQQLQHLVTEIIDHYQQNDAEYMEKFQTLINHEAATEENNNVT